MHGIGRFALARDDVAGDELLALAIFSQDVGEFGVAERVGEPFVQRARAAVGVAMGGNDGVLAEFERAIDLRKDHDVLLITWLSPKAFSIDGVR